MIQYLGIIDKINDLNEKINSSLGDKLSNLPIGIAVLGVLLFIVIFTINELNKK